MKLIDLNGQWAMKDVQGQEWLPAQVPGTVYSDLLRAERVPDPYHRDNELKIQDVFKKDYEFRREFSISPEQLQHDQLQLTCLGLDTLADIHINGQLVASTDNMFRTYRFPVKDLLRPGVNDIRVVFTSPIKHLKKISRFSLGISMNGAKGVEKLRKAQCMFGWDWGMKLPDSGIWRDIAIEAFDAARIADVYVLQQHKGGQVTLSIDVESEIWAAQPLTLEATLTSPAGETQPATVAASPNAKLQIVVPNPQLWWPNGYGEQPLYRLAVRLKQDDAVVDERPLRVGLRTIKLRREEDTFGQSYEFVVNGLPIFVRGSNLIIEDNLLSRYSPERAERMIRDCVDSNFNCIRVWGGALYPADYFYDLCDEYGLIVYQDLMFACNFYPTNEAFLENVAAEVADNVKRARNHACIGVWSGNNENEMILGLVASKEEMAAQFRKFFGIPRIPDLFLHGVLKNYLKLFYDVLPELLAKLDPQTDFVSCSPTSGKPTLPIVMPDVNRGDSHYYLAYDNLSPYAKIRTLKFRFVSEMGFQSYPDWRTVLSFTEEEDRTPYSKVMLQHQKCRNGNQIIESYLAQDYRVPADFSLYVYASQVLAGEIQKYSVEHFRRDSARCRGVITWQLNDCWPVVSWAGIDYYGRWKAQQYYTKRFYQPVLLSACEDGVKVDLVLNNDGRQDLTGEVVWRLLDPAANTIDSGRQEVAAPALTTLTALSLDFSGKVTDDNKAERVLAFAYVVDGREISSGTLLFALAKDFRFIDPQLSTSVSEVEGVYQVWVNSAAYAKAVRLALSDADCVFSDDYFDVTRGETVVTADPAHISPPLSAEEFAAKLTAISLYDVCK